MQKYTEVERSHWGRAWRKITASGCYRSHLSYSFNGFEFSALLLNNYPLMQKRVRSSLYCLVIYIMNSLLHNSSPKYIMAIQRKLYRSKYTSKNYVGLCRFLRNIMFSIRIDHHHRGKRSIA